MEDNFYDKYFRYLQLQVKEIDFLISKCPEESVIFQDLIGLKEDNIFLIYLMKDFPEKKNIGFRLFLERILRLRFKILTSESTAIEATFKEVLSFYKKKYEFFKAFQPLEKDHKNSAKALQLCETMYAANIKHAQEFGFDLPKDIKTVNRKKELYTDSMRAFIRKDPQFDDSSVSTTLVIYDYLSESIHPNFTEAFKNKELDDRQDGINLGIIAVQSGNVLNLARSFLEVNYSIDFEDTGSSPA